MTTPDIQQAKEWAKNPKAYPQHTFLPSAARVIRSLPDHIIDAKKVAELADDMANWSLLEMPSTAADDRRHLIELLGGFADRINDLLTPPLPTLAELIEQGNDPQKYVGMQCMIHDFPSTRVITKVKGFHVSVLREDLEIQHTDTSKVTPLPDLPKLEWPAQEPRNSEEIVKVIRYEKELCLDSQDFSRAGLWRDMERAAGQGEWKDLLNSIRELKLPKDSGTPRNPRPEDVPAGEAWLILHNGHEWVGARDSRDGANYPWALARLDGLAVESAEDSEIDTLVSRLVPEVGV